VIKELISEETRPRVLKDEDGILLNLRGLNLNPDSDEEDMVSLHMWIEPGRIITTRSERVFPIDDIDQSYQKGDGPRTAAGFLIRVLDGLTDFYQLTMAQGYCEKGKTEQAVFDLFYRENPSGNGYAVFAGLEQII